MLAWLFRRGDDGMQAPDRHLPAVCAPSAPRLAVVADDLQTARTRREIERNCRPLERHTACEHAKRLLQWIRDDETVGWNGEITFPIMIQIYREMCAELHWAERPWNPVAHQFRLLTTGKKDQDTMPGRRGKRIYIIPTPSVPRAQPQDEHRRAVA